MSNDKQCRKNAKKKTKTIKNLPDNFKYSSSSVIFDAKACKYPRASFSSDTH